MLTMHEAALGKNVCEKQRGAFTCWKNDRRKAQSCHVWVQGVVVCVHPPTLHPNRQTFTKAPLEVQRGGGGASHVIR